MLTNGVRETIILTGPSNIIRFFLSLCGFFWAASTCPFPLAASLHFCCIIYLNSIKKLYFKKYIWFYVVILYLTLCCCRQCIKLPEHLGNLVFVWNQFYLSELLVVKSVICCSICCYLTLDNWLECKCVCASTSQFDPPSPSAEHNAITAVEKRTVSVCARLVFCVTNFSESNFSLSVSCPLRLCLTLSPASVP